MARKILLGACCLFLAGGLLACVEEAPVVDDKSTLSEDGLSLEDAADGSADGFGANQGRLEWGQLNIATLSRWQPVHFWDFEVHDGDSIFLDLASRDGHDMFLVLGRENANGRFERVARNDDCYDGTLNACLELENLEAGNYRVAATTWRFAFRGRVRSEVEYHLTLWCRPDGASCGAPQVCGTRGAGPCPDGQFCNWTTDDTSAACGALDHGGFCEPILDVSRCDAVRGFPVCGCDGNTYSNSCYAHANGVDVSTLSACEEPTLTCGGFIGERCPQGMLCSYADAPAGCGWADLQGTCIDDTAPLCTEQYAPECGCDGNTYSNDCFRQGAGVALAYRGECERPAAGEGETCGGIAAIQCGEGFYCDMSNQRQCHPDMAGTCAVQELTACTRIYAPVCGCNGQTYGNDCERVKTGEALDYVGACEADGVGEMCGGIAGFRCNEGLECDYSANDICMSDMAGTCREPTNTLCTLQYDPVCGCNGTTYGNDCQRRGAGVALSHGGACGR